MALSIEYDKSQFTPGKIVLVVGLAGCLLWMVVGGKTEPKLELARPKSDVAKARESVDRSDELKRRQQRRKAWERLTYNLDEMQKNDPFAVLGKRSASSPDTAIAGNPDDPEQDEEAIAAAANAKAEEVKRIQALKEEAERRKAREQRISDRIALLQKQKVDAVFRSNGRTTALIGYKEINEGDLLDDGIRVVKITPKGLTLSVDESIFDEQSPNESSDGDDTAPLEEAVRSLPTKRSAGPVRPQPR